MSRKPPVRVSNHALFRWLQRSGSVDIEALRNVLSGALDRAYQAGAAMGAGEFLILSGGMVFVVRDGVVVTAVEKDRRHSHGHLLAKRAERDGRDED